MSSTVAIDALPYYDHGYDEPGVREAAVKLVEEEMQRYRPTKDYLEEINLPAPGKSFDFTIELIFQIMICFFPMFSKPKFRASKTKNPWNSSVQNDTIYLHLLQERLIFS